MAESPQFLVEGKGVSKDFKDFWGRPKVRAVTDVDICVRQGTVLGLLGPNGAGKSTLMKLILGHLYPTAGRIVVFGKHPTDVESKRRLGYVPERAHLYKHLTPVEMLHFFGELLELPGDVIRSRTDQLLEMVGLAGAGKRLVGEFSHGMGRRMGLAQALLNDPDLLLLDEPTAGLDPLGCRDVKDLILALADRGKTVILTSHLLADVEDVCDELLIMYGGRVQAFGAAEDLLAEKDRLQIIMPRGNAAALAKIRETLAAEFEPAAVEVGAPTRTLENYFLDVVREASQTQETHGALMGSGVAGYLRGDSSMLKPPAASEPKAEAASTAPAVSPEPAASPATAPAPPAKTPAAGEADETSGLHEASEPAAAKPEQTEPEQTEPEQTEPEQTPTVVVPADAEADQAPKPAAPESEPADWPRATAAADAPPERPQDDDNDDEDDIDQDLLDSLTQ